MNIFYKPNVIMKNTDSRFLGRRIIVTQGILEIKGEFIPALSGGWGKGTIPHGEYLVQMPVKLKDEKQNNSYRGEDFPWIARLEPQFYMPDRNGFAIHPDGGVKGTMGCISPINNDMHVYFTLLELCKLGKVFLYVW